jgi:hypothetical protein
MENEMIDKIKNSVKNIDEKINKIYFFVQDTRGNARASTRYIYDMAMTLKNNGYNIIMLYEKKDFTPVTSWLTGQYDELKHQSLEGTNLEIAPEDVLVIPEIFGFVMEQVKNLPCGKIVLTQAYDHILETLAPGATWSQYGFLKCITTSEAQKEQVSKIMKHMSIEVIEPTIHESFVPQKYPPKPMIGVWSREQRDGLNVIKQFYIKYPQYRFFTFKDLRGLSQDEFANSLQDCFLGVWIDPTSGFGTFPLECMRTGIPIVGRIPYLTPEWMNEKNGIWMDNPNQMVDVIADIAQTWLEDNLSQELYDEGKKTAEKYIDKEKFDFSVVSTFSSFINKRREAFESQIENLSK